MAYALSLCIDQDLLSLNRAVGELRRRNLAIESLAVGPGDGPGETRLTVIVNADDATAEMAMRKLDKLSGVRGATRFRVEDGITHELALAKVHVPQERFAELRDLCARHTATVVAELPDEAIVELAGSGSAILAFVRALETFGVRELVRSGPVALTRHPHPELHRTPNRKERPMSRTSLRVYYDADADLTRLSGRTVAIIGYGSQGHAHALNLRESGVTVLVGLRPGGGSWARATAAGLTVRPVAEAARAADTIMMLVPDQHARAVYDAEVAAGLAPGKTLMFAHGFNVHFKEITPPPGVDVSMVAPKSPGHLVRSEFQAGRGVPALVAVAQDASGHALADALAYAAGIGCTRAGVLPTTFREETESDLFGEQVVLCGGVTALVTAGFETLVAAGYAPELAYFECLHELKLIVDLMYRGGMKFMRYSISDTAEYGDYTRGPTLITPAVRARMQQILADIQSGAFAREWIDESRQGGPTFERLRREQNDHLIERVGAELRAMMPWSEEGKARAAADLRPPRPATGAPKEPAAAR